MTPNEAGELSAAQRLVKARSSLSEATSLTNKMDELHQRGNAFADDAFAVYQELRNKNADEVLRAPLPHFVQPWLFGLFVPPPVWNPATRMNKRITLIGCLRNAAALSAVLVVIGGGLSILLCGIGLALLPLLPLITLATPPTACVLGGLHLVRRRRRSQRTGAQDAESSSKHSEVLDELHATHAMQEAQAVLARVHPAADSPTFNGHVRSATSLAVYGCGILAATHVGGLRALEQRGLRYESLTTLAGVSAGSVVVAMLAVGYTADSLFDQVLRMPFHRLPHPELGALLRATGNLLITLITKIARGWAAPRSLQEISESNGPGLNSGAVMEQLIGDALEGAPLADLARARGIVMRDITLGEVLEVYGKRLVIIVTELDTGRERRLTPDVINGRTDRHLPVRVAVRMSMGVPGLFEPFRYQGHVYCDGGMMNDFPMNALPNDGHRLGLMVRPKPWVKAHLGALKGRVKGWLESSAPGRASELQEWLAEWLQADKAMQQGPSSLQVSTSIYPVRDTFDLMETCMQTMMDANLNLQILNAHREGRSVARQSRWRGMVPPSLEGMVPPSLWRSASEDVMELVAPKRAPAVPTPLTERGERAEGGGDEANDAAVTPGEAEQTWPVEEEELLEAEEDDEEMARRSFFVLSPQILTLCGGSFSPFDFSLSATQHKQLFLSGQLSVHLAASEMQDAQADSMSDTDRVSALRYLMSFS